MEGWERAPIRVSLCAEGCLSWTPSCDRLCFPKQSHLWTTEAGCPGAFPVCLNASLSAGESLGGREKGCSELQGG